MIRKTALILSISLFCFLGAAKAAPTRSNAGTAPSTQIKRSSLLVKLSKAREARIAALKEYVKSGKFPWGKKGEKAIGKDDPHFDHQHERTHRFRGPNGELCALAFLIWQSGDKDLVNEIVKNDNHFCLGKDKNPKVEAWILNSGLTREECLAIQEPGFTNRPPRSIRLRPIAELEQRSRIRAHLQGVLKALEKNKTVSLKKALSAKVAELKAQGKTA